MRRTSWSMGLLLLLLAVELGCGASLMGESTVATPRLSPPDLHGEPLVLLPPGAVVWARIDGTAVRSSQHWGAVRELLQSTIADELRGLERELGFDLVQVSEAFAVGFYAPPGNPGARLWPVFYARGNFSSQAILAAAAARAPDNEPLTERTEGSARFHATRSRAYYFPSPDVFFLFDPALTRRVMGQLAGEAPGGVTGDPRFQQLWEQTGGVTGAIRGAVDAVALRRAGALRVVAGAPGGADQSAERVVLRAELNEGVRVWSAAEMASAQDAQRVVSAAEELRQGLLGRLEVRFLFGRLLAQGITVVNEGPTVRLAIEARDNEVGSLLQARRLMEWFGG